MESQLKKFLDGTKESHQKLLIYLVIALVTLVCFANSLSSEFVSDDHALIEENPNIKSLSTIKNLFFESYFHNIPLIGHYRPLTNLSFALNFMIGGTDSYGYHLTNILIHIINSWLIYWLSEKYCGTKFLAFLAALFFSVHPLHSEVVCTIYGRADLLATAFLLIAWASYLKLENNKVFYFISLVSYFFSLLCKESGIVLIGIFILAQICQQGIWKNKFILNKETAGYILTTIGYLVIRVLVTKSLGVPKSKQVFLNESFLTRVYTMSLGYLKYFQVLIWPSQLCSEYNSDIITTTKVLTLWVFLSLALIFFLIFLSLWQIRKYPIVAFAILFFFVTTSVISNIIVPTAILIAERALYLPLASICLLLATIIYKIYLMGWQRLSLVIFIILLMAASIRTYYRNVDFQNDLNMLTSVLRVSPDYVASNHSLGSYYEQHDEFDKAEIYFKRAMKKDPSYGFIYATLANLYIRQRRYDEALPLIDKQLLITPNSIFAYVALARLYERKQDYQKSAEAYLLAIKYSPPDARLEQEAALALYSINDLELASTHLKKAIILDPHFAEPYVNLAKILQKQNKYEESQLILDKALQLETNNAEIYNLYGRFFLSQANLCEAKDQIFKALSINQQLADAHFNLGLVYIEMNLYKEAKSSLRNALVINPKLALVKETLMSLEQKQPTSAPINCPN